MILDRELQFVAKLTKKLNRIFIRVENGRLYLFSFSFINWDLELGFSMMSHMNVTSLSQISQSHHNIT